MSHILEVEITGGFGNDLITNNTDSLPMLFFLKYFSKLFNQPKCNVVNTLHLVTQCNKVTHYKPIDNVNSPLYAKR